MSIFVTSGVPELHKADLEAACEDFSNIILSTPFCMLYKGTLSSGVEVAVVSTTLASEDWSKRSEAYFRKKVCDPHPLVLVDPFYPLSSYKQLLWYFKLIGVLHFLCV